MYSPANQRGFMQTDGKYLQLNNLFIFKTRSNLSKHKVSITKQTPAQVGWDKKEKRWQLWPVSLSRMITKIG